MVQIKCSPLMIQIMFALHFSALLFQIANGTDAVMIAMDVVMQLYYDPITSGGLLKMPKIIQDLTDLHKSQLMDNQIETSNSNYTKHTFHIIDELLRQEISWKELPDEDRRYQTSSDLLFEVKISFGLMYIKFFHAIFFLGRYDRGIQTSRNKEKRWAIMCDKK